MASSAYLRTCKQCGTTWTVPADLATQERPTMQGMASQLGSLIGGGFNGQVAFQEHYRQLGAAAKCPKCGKSSFTQEPAPESAPSADTSASAGSAAPAAPAAPSAPQDPSAPSSWVSPAFVQQVFGQQPRAPQAPAQQVPVPQTAVPDGQPRTYVLNQQLFSLTGDAWIEDGQGNRVFAVSGQLISLRGTHVLKDLQGQELYEVSKPLAPHIHKTIEIKRGGQTIATVQEAVFHFGGDKFTITNAGGQTLSMRGNWGGREFQLADPSGREVVHVSRVWFSMHNGYGVQIAPDFDVPLGLALVIALERVEAEERGEQSPAQNLLGGLGGIVRF